MGPLIVRFLADRPGRLPFSALHIALAPGKNHPSISHSRTHEFFAVLRGEARAVIDGVRRRLRRGDFAVLSPGAAHSFRAGPRGVEALVIFAPAMDFKRPDIVSSVATVHLTARSASDRFNERGETGRRAIRLKPACRSQRTYSSAA
jgi:quercetin dioxygenase-like cupin family protein